LRQTAIITLLLIIISLFVVPASASNITVTVDKQQVKAKFILSLQQNVTVLPSQTGTLTLASDAKLSSAFTDALRQGNSSAAPSDLTLNLDSTTAAFDITTTMTVAGITQRHGDILTVDMGWKAFNVSSDLRAGNLSYNTIGSRYLRPIAAFYSNASLFIGKPNQTITGVSFFVNKTSVGGSTAENYVGNFTIFNFKALNAPLEAWSRTYSLTNNTTTWRYTPPQSLNFSIQVQQFNKTRNLLASYGYGAEVTVPGLARAQGNTLFLDIGTGQTEWIMSGIVVMAIVLAIVTQLLFRAKKKKYVKFGRW
jgi:hypothetical protein